MNSDSSARGILVLFQQGNVPLLTEHWTGHLKETQSLGPAVLKNKVERQTGPYGLYRA